MLRMPGIKEARKVLSPCSSKQLSCTSKAETNRQGQASKPAYRTASEQVSRAGCCAAARVTLHVCFVGCVERRDLGVREALDYAACK